LREVTNEYLTTGMNTLWAGQSWTQATGQSAVAIRTPSLADTINDYRYLFLDC